MRVKNIYQLQTKLDHLAIIMDGNGRWAKKRLLPRTAGHKVGCERIFDITELMGKYGIKVLTIYAFSTENWKRPQSEIDFLFSYLESEFGKRIPRLIELGVKVRTMGDLSRLPASTVAVIERAIEATKDCTTTILNICLNYGGRAELLRATKLIYRDGIAGKINPEQLTEADFEKYLYSSDLPPVDLLIRTSGEQRTSNFLPWQLAYAEFIFPAVHWPDFNEKHLVECLSAYDQRNRRFGDAK